MDSKNQDTKNSGLSLAGVHKSFGKQKVLNGLSLHLRSGELTLLLGQNGSGKSTLLRICADLSRPDAGSVTVCEASKRRLLPAEIGYLGHQPMLYSALSTKENLTLTKTLLGADLDIDQHLNRWQLSELANKPISELSKGQQFRVGLARSLLQSPKFIFLDEPSAALDDMSMKTLLLELRRMCKEEDRPATACIATHDIARFEDVADRAIVLAHGLIARDSAQESGASVKATIQFYREINR